MNSARPSIVLSLRVRRPWVTYALVAINVAAFVLSGLWGNAVEERILTRYGQDRGAVWAGEYWRVVTGMFVHAGFAHVFLNLMALGLIGRILERLLGHWRFGAIYLVSGLAGALFFQVFSSASLGLGASGAVYGIFAAFLVLKSNLRTLGRAAAALRSFLAWAILILVLDQLVALLMEAGAGVGVASSAHLGGFFAGSILGFGTLHRVLPVARWQPRLRLAAQGALLLFLVGMGWYAVTVPPHGEVWESAVARRALLRKLQGRDIDGAAAAWRSLPNPGEQHHRELGYWVFEELMAAGRAEEAYQILDRLIELGARALEEARDERGLTPDLANEVAWYAAMRGSDLGRARSLADHAVRAARRKLPGRAWTWLFPASSEVEKLGMYLNTRGWIDFRMGETRKALEDLREAAELLPVGGNFVYLAWAYYSVQEIQNCREAVRRAHEAGSFTPYEEYLLEDLEARLGEVRSG